VARRLTPQGTPAIRDLPPVSTPIPNSNATPSIPISLPDGSKLSRHTLRKLWVIVGPIVVTAATSVFGYLKGYAKGLEDAAERVAKLETAASIEAQSRAKLEFRVTNTENELAAEESSTRKERATALERWRTTTEDLEEVKKRLPSIQGLPPRR
jgi:hypothetical protein